MPYSNASPTGQPNPDQSASSSRSPGFSCATTTACNNGSPSTTIQAAGGHTSSSSALWSPTLQHSSSLSVHKKMSALTFGDRPPPAVEAKQSKILASSSQQADRSLADSALLRLGSQKQQPSSKTPSTLSSMSLSSSSPSSHQLAPLRFDGESDLSLSHELGSFLSENTSVSRVVAVSSPSKNSSIVSSRVPQVLPTKAEPCAITAAVVVNSNGIHTTATAHPVSTPPSGHISSSSADSSLVMEAQGHTKPVLLPSPPTPNSATAATTSQASVDFAPSKGPTLPSISSSFSLSSSFASSFSSSIHSLQQQQQLLSTSTSTSTPTPTTHRPPLHNSYTTTPTIPTMSLPSPPTLPSDTIIDNQLPQQPTATVSIDSTSDEEHLKTIAQQYHQLMTPSIPHTSNTVSGDNTPNSRASLSDDAPSPSRMSTSSQSSYSSNDGHHQQHPGYSQRPMNIAPLTLETLKPVPQKSEDWAALVDTPASPIERFHPGMMMMPPLPPPVLAGSRPLSPSSSFQFQAGPQTRGMIMTTPSGATYTDSPGPESSADYIQHVSQQQQHQHQQQQHQQYHMPHAQTDPGPRQQQYPYSQHHQQGHFPYQHHQHHNSTPSFQVGTFEMTDASSPDSSTAAAAANANAHSKSYRKSWSASETLDAYGTLTPPRMNLDHYRGSAASSSRGSLNSSNNKPSSAAMSVSLLTDAAILAKYRETAIKTNDASIQLSFAKYLLEIGDPDSTYEPVVEESNNNNSSDPAAALPPRPASAAGSNNSPPSSAPSSPATGPQDPKTGKKQLILEGVYWIDRLAKEGHPEAQFIRGTWYEEGMYLAKKNADKALRWYQSSSKGDYGPAHYKVAYFCEKKKDNNKAVILYKKAAIHNDVPANHRLAMVYLYGDLGQSQNMKAGLQYLKRAASLATEAAPMSPYVLGLILSRDYSKQLKIPDDISFPDDGEALEWFRKSAQLGYGPANYKLGYCYEYGSLGCPIDPFLSVQHYDRAVMGGDSNGEAEMALSGWYLSGADNYFAADDR
ncbi:hypothetical protein BGZ95_010914, partial [Linnemannia exigua]